MMQRSVLLTALLLGALCVVAVAVASPVIVGGLAVGLLYALARLGRSGALLARGIIVACCGLALVVCLGWAAGHARALSGTAIVGVLLPGALGLARAGCVLAAVALLTQLVGARRAADGLAAWCGRGAVILIAPLALCAVYPEVWRRGRRLQLHGARLALGESSTLLLQETRIWLGDWLDEHHARAGVRWLEALLVFLGLAACAMPVLTTVLGLRVPFLDNGPLLLGLALLAVLGLRGIAVLVAHASWQRIVASAPMLVGLVGLGLAWLGSQQLGEQLAATTTPITMLCGAVVAVALLHIDVARGEGVAA